MDQISASTVAGESIGVLSDLNSRTEEALSRSVVHLGAALGMSDEERDRLRPALHEAAVTIAGRGQTYGWALDQIERLVIGAANRGDAGMQELQGKLAELVRYPAPPLAQAPKPRRENKYCSRPPGRR